MVAWWKRILFSLLSLLAASILVCAFTTIVYSDPNEYLPIFLAASLWTFFVGILGWFLALPVLLTFSNFHGWRFWFFLTIGSSLGPIIIILFTLYYFATTPHLVQAIMDFLRSIDLQFFSSGTMFPVYQALAVSFFTTLIYLLLFRWQFRNSRQYKGPIISAWLAMVYAIYFFSGWVCATRSLMSFFICALNSVWRAVILGNSIAIYSFIICGWSLSRCCPVGVL